MPKLTVALLCGGISPEHEVSMNSARNIYKALDKEKYDVEIIGIARNGSWRHLPVELFEKLESVQGPEGREIAILPGRANVFYYSPSFHEFPKIDVVFNIIHGPSGEDGTLQGMMQILRLPFVGPDTLGSSIGMDKDVTKRILDHAGIRVVPWVTLFRHEQIDYQAIGQELGFPVFVKPANMGSSVGVSKAENVEELISAVNLAFKYDKKILVEKGIAGREFETALLGNLEEVQVAGVGEIVMEKGFYDYESKYLSADAARVVVPAKNVSENAIENIRQIALKAFRALALEGMARMDVFLDDDGTVYVNEPNTLPGFTNISMYPKLWADAGIDYAALIDRLIGLALRRHERDDRLERSRN